MSAALQALATGRDHEFWFFIPRWRLLVALGGDRATSNKCLDDFIQSIRDRASEVQDATRMTGDHQADAAEFMEFTKPKYWPLWKAQ
jgi:hypothetical protein